MLGETAALRNVKCIFAKFEMQQMPLDSHFGRWFRDRVQLVSRTIHGGLLVGEGSYTHIAPSWWRLYVWTPRKICVAAACAYSHLQTGPPTAEAILTIATWQLDNAQNKDTAVSADVCYWVRGLDTEQDQTLLLFSCRSPVCLQWWIFSTIFTVFVTFDVYLNQHHVEAHLCDVHDFDGSQLSSFDMTSLWRHKT